jgi:hypothetical protein
MKRLLTKFRDWWNRPIKEQVGLSYTIWCDDITRVHRQLTELNNQMDFLKYQVAGLMSDEEWRKALAGRKSTLKLQQPSGCPSLE